MTLAALRRDQWDERLDVQDRARDAIAASPELAALLRDLLTRPEWMSRAACRTERTATFFPPRGANASRFTQRAREVCAGCPVQDDCLAYALDRRESYGTWAGVPEKELRVMSVRTPGRGGRPVPREAAPDR